MNKAALIALFITVGFGLSCCAHADCNHTALYEIGWREVPERLRPLTVFYDEQGITERTLQGKRYRKFECDGKWRYRKMTGDRRVT